MNLLIYLMSGRGRRMGNEIPKQYISVNEKPLFYYALEKYLENKLIDKIIIVSNPEYSNLLDGSIRAILERNNCDIIAGGESRLESINNGVIYANNYLKRDDIVLIQDANIPVLNLDSLDKIILSIYQFHYVAVATKQTRTVYQYEKDGFISACIPRENLACAYGLEGFLFEKIYKYFSTLKKSELSRNVSISTLLLESNIKVKYFKIEALNFKITYEYELDMYKKLLESK